jgi:hypothetical protein
MRSVQTSPFSKNPFVDLRELATNVSRLGFHIGANEGQTACELRRVFPEARINCFESCEAAFRTLHQELSGDLRVCIERIAFGDHKGEATLYEIGESVTNSLLPNALEAHVFQPASYAVPTANPRWRSQRSMNSAANEPSLALIS